MQLEFYASMQKQSRKILNAALKLNIILFLTEPLRGRVEASSLSEVKRRSFVIFSVTVNDHRRVEVPVY